MDVSAFPDPVNPLQDPQYAGLTAQVETHPQLKGVLPCSASAISYVLLPLSDLATLVAALAALQHHQYPAAAPALTNYLSGAYVVVQEAMAAPPAAAAAAPGIKLRRIQAMQLDLAGDLQRTQLLLCDGTWAAAGDVREGLGGQEAPLQELAWRQAQKLSPALTMPLLVHTLCRLAALFAAQANAAALQAKGFEGLAADAAASLPQMVPCAVGLQDTMDPMEAAMLALAWQQQLSATPAPPAGLAPAPAAAALGAAPMVAAVQRMAAPAAPQGTAAAAAGSSVDPAVVGAKRPRQEGPAAGAVAGRDQAADPAPPAGKKARSTPPPSQQQQKAHQNEAQQQQEQRQEQEKSKRRKGKNRKKSKREHEEEEVESGQEQRKAGQPPSKTAKVKGQQHSMPVADGGAQGVQQTQRPAATAAASTHGHRENSQDPVAAAVAVAALRGVAAASRAAVSRRAGSSAAAAGGTGQEHARGDKLAAAAPDRKARGSDNSAAAAARAAQHADGRAARAAAHLEGREGGEGNRGQQRSRSRLRPGARVTRSSRSLSGGRMRAGPSPPRDADGRRPDADGRRAGAVRGRPGRSRSRSPSGGRVRGANGMAAHRDADGRRPGQGQGRRGQSPPRSRSRGRRRSLERSRERSRDRRPNRGLSPDRVSRRREAEGEAERRPRCSLGRGRSPARRRSCSRSWSPPRRDRSPYLGPKPSAARASAAPAAAPAAAVAAAAADEAAAGKDAAGRCEVCQKPCTQQCSGCRRAFYCSSECQRYHWNDTHRWECSPQIDDAQTAAAGEQQQQQQQQGQQQQQQQGQQQQQQGGDTGARTGITFTLQQHSQPRAQLQPAIAARAAAGAAAAAAVQDGAPTGIFDLRNLLTQRRAASGGQPELPSPGAGAGPVVVSALQRLTLPDATGAGASAPGHAGPAAAAGGGGDAVAANKGWAARLAQVGAAVTHAAAADPAAAAQPEAATDAILGGASAMPAAEAAAAANAAAARPGTGRVFDRLQVLDDLAAGGWGDAHLEHDQQQTGDLVSADWVQALAAQVVTHLTSSSAAQAQVESLPRELREYVVGLYDCLLDCQGWQMTLAQMLKTKGRVPDHLVEAAGGIYQFLEQLPGLMFDRRSRVLTLDPEYQAAAQAYKMQHIMRDHTQQQRAQQQQQQEVALGQDKGKNMEEGGHPGPSKRRQQQQQQQQQQPKEVNPELQKRLGAPPAQQKERPLQVRLGTPPPGQQELQHDSSEAQQLLSDTLQEVRTQQQRPAEQQQAAAAAPSQPAGGRPPRQQQAPAAARPPAAAAAPGFQSRLEQHPAYAVCAQRLREQLQRSPKHSLHLDDVRECVKPPMILLSLAGGMWRFIESVKGVTCDRRRQLVALAQLPVSQQQPPPQQQQQVRQPILPPQPQQQGANAVVVDLRGGAAQPQRTVVDLRGPRPPAAGQCGALSPDIQHQMQQHATQLGQGLPALRPGSAGSNRSASSSREPSVAASPRVNSPVISPTQQLQLQPAPWMGGPLVRLPNRRQLATLLDDWGKAMEKKIVRKGVCHIDIEEAAALLPALLRCYVEPKGPWTARKLLHDNMFGFNLADADGKTTVSVCKVGSKRPYVGQCPRWDPLQPDACSSGASCKLRHTLPVAPSAPPSREGSRGMPLHGGLL